VLGSTSVTAVYEPGARNASGRLMADGGPRLVDFLSLLCGCVGQSLAWQAQNFPWTRFPDSGYALPRLTFPAI